MKSLYELLLKVGTNPQLRAWAAKQMINLKSLRSGYKDSFQHSMDKNKVKDILDPKWLNKEILAEKAYSLKNKVLDMTKAKNKLKHIKSKIQADKDKFQGVTGQVETMLKNFKGKVDDIFKKSDAQSKWFSDTLGKKLKGDKKAGIELDKYFANIEKISKEKVVPFVKEGKDYSKFFKKAEGGRIGFNKGSKKGGIGDLLTQLYRLSQIGPLLSSPELVDLIQKIPMAEGGIAELLGEPRSGYQGGGDVGYQKYWKMVTDMFIQLGGEEELKMTLHQFADKEFPRPGQAKGGRIGYDEGGIGGWLKKKLKKKIKPYTKEGRTEYKKEWLDKKDLNMTPEEWDELPLKERIKIKIREGNAQGGRIGLADGDTPSQAWMRDNFYSSGLDDLGVITLDDYINGGQGWRDYMDHGPGKAEGGRIGYDNGGPVMDLDHWAQLIFQKPYDQLTSSQQEHITSFKPEKAEGGRIGFKDGEGIMSRTGDMVDMRNIPYYGGKALQGLVNSAETLSKFPLAAGKLTSDLIQKQGFKRVPREKSDDPIEELFLQQTGQDYKLKPTDAWGEAWGEALENITPGSWSENLGLTSLVEGMREKRPDDAKTVGDILGLGTEIAVPTGGAFKAGQLLLSKASKAMGKVKDGKTLEKLVDQKLTDAGQSRRDFNIMAATGTLVGALKWLGLGGLLKTASKKVDDIRVTYKTGVNEPYEWDDVATWAGNYEFESLTAKGINILKKVFGKDGVRTVKDPSGKLTGYVDNVDIGEAVSWVDDVKKAGGKMELEHADDYGNTGKVYESTNKKGIKLTDKQEFLNASGIDSGYGLYDDSIDEVYDIVYGKAVKESRRKHGFSRKVKKAEGGRIGLGAGGPPLQFGIAEAEWKAKHPVQGTKVSQLKDAAMDRALPGTGLRGSANMGNFEAFYNQPLIDPMNMFEKSREPQYGLQYEKGPFSAGVGVMPSGEREYGFKLRKEFNDGGLTKTVPPKRGPDPQGLPSALYNGIMRPRSY